METKAAETLGPTSLSSSSNKNSILTQILWTGRELSSKLKRKRPRPHIEGI
jgi:hypothetical protein